MSCSISNSTCLNGGSCQGNFCICPNECYYGVRCEKHINYLELPMTSAMAIDTHAAQVIYIIIFILFSIMGLINNCLGLITSLRERIRLTTCGTYLSIIFFSNLILMILISTNIITLSGNDNQHYVNWHCYFHSYLSLTLDYVYIWISVAIMIEKLLIEYLNFDIYGSRFRAFILSIIIIIMLAVSNLPEMFTRETQIDSSNRVTCSYKTKKDTNWYKIQYTITLINIIVPAAAHIICIVCILTNIARRKIFISGDGRSSKRLKFGQVWIEQLKFHREFLISPVVIIFCMLPHSIVHCTLLSMCNVYDATTLTRLHIVTVLLLSVPATVTFLLYIYPDPSYLMEFKQTVIYRKFLIRLFDRHGIDTDVRQRSWSSSTMTSTLEDA